MNRAKVISIVGLLVMAHRVYPVCSATVSGKVVDENGKPIPQAQVSLSEIAAGTSHKATRFFSTDTGGSFRGEVDLVKPTWYWVLAKKEDAGFPDTRLAFYDNRLPPKIFLGCDASVSNIAVVIGPKAAFITHISVVNAKTGAAIPAASITLRRLSAPIRDFPLERFSIRTSATILKPDSTYLGLAVPSNEDVAYEISAPGYKASVTNTIHLPALKTTTISVALEPLSDGGKH